MDFELSDEQQALREAARDVLRGYDPNVDAERRRSVTKEAPGFDTALWSRLADLGLLGLPFSEDDGGMGAGPVEVAVVAEEIGRVLAPEPYVAAVAYAGGLVAAAGSEEQRAELLGGLSSGERLLAYAHGEQADVVVAGAAAHTIVWHVGNDLFVAEAPAGAEGYRTPDGSWAARLQFDRSAATPLASGTPEAITAALARAQIVACHEALGAMEAALEMTVGYLKTRQQFGVTLNRFQALTFRAADMYTDLELARSMVTWASMVASETDDAGTLHEAAARAKLQTIRASRRIGQEAIQLHGGIGVTAEYAVGWYTARLTSLAHWMGDANAQLHLLSGLLPEHGVLDPMEV